MHKIDSDNLVSIFKHSYFEVLGVLEEAIYRLRSVRYSPAVIPLLIG